MFPIKGASFTELTSSMNVMKLLAPLVSVTVRVIADVPVALRAGTARNERFVPVPLTTRVSLGIRAVFDETAETVNVSGGESSDTVNGISMGVSSDVLWLKTREIVGARFWPA